jgi:ribonuclease VapC
MFIDASAIVAIVAPEEDGPALSARLDQTDIVRTSPISIYEAVLGLARKLDISVVDAGEAVDNFIKSSQTEIIPITAEIGRVAITAFERFGRGRHPARLNMGDCFAYACARSLDVPLLFKDDDFAQTDIAVA